MHQVLLNTMSRPTVCQALLGPEIQLNIFTASSGAHIQHGRLLSTVHWDQCLTKCVDGDWLEELGTWGCCRNVSQSR